MSRKRVVRTLVVLAVVGVFCAALTVSYAAGHPSAKATCKVSKLYLINWINWEGPGVGTWQPLLSNTIKTANKKNLFIDVSLECGLYTKTKARGKGGNKGTSIADAMIKVHVLVDGNEVPPGEVVFARRYQELSAELEGMIGDALYLDDGDVLVDQDLVTTETIDLVLETMSANAFNFVTGNLGPGVHEVSVEAMVCFPGDTTVYEPGETEVRAMVGKGAVTVQEVRMIKDEQIIFE